MCVLVVGRPDPPYLLLFARMHCTVVQPVSLSPAILYIPLPSLYAVAVEAPHSAVGYPTVPLPVVTALDPEMHNSASIVQVYPLSAVDYKQVAALERSRF